MHMEHLNQIVETAVKHLGPNKCGNAITRVSRALGPLSEVLWVFDNNFEVSKQSGHHTVASSSSDCHLVLEELKQSSVFQSKPGCKHTRFSSIRGSLLRKVSTKKLKEWLQEHMTF